MLLQVKTDFVKKTECSVCKNIKMLFPFFFFFFFFYKWTIKNITPLWLLIFIIYWDLMKYRNLQFVQF